MMDPTQPAAPAQPPSDAAPSGAICIAPQGDGTFQVYAEGQEDSGQAAPDVDAALQAAKQLLAGGVPAQPGTGNDDAEALFQGGFAGARGQLNKG